MILVEDKERVRFMKFAAVGALGAAIDFSVMNLMSHLFGMPLVYAGTISFICAVVSHLLHQLGMFFLVNAAGIAFRIPTLHFVEPLMTGLFQRAGHLSNPTAQFLAKNATLAFAIGVVMIWNFFINRYWTYNDID
jgi:putative flippase GtrA